MPDDDARAAKRTRGRRRLHSRARTRISVCAAVFMGGLRRWQCSNRIRHSDINPRGCRVFANIFYEIFKNIFSLS